MVIPTYNLEDMRSQIRSEFGIDSTDLAQDQIINQKINEAVASVVRERPNWPWQRKTLSLDVSAKTSVTADFTKGSRSVSNVADSNGDDLTASVRQVLIAGTQPSIGSSYYTVESASVGSVTLGHQFLGATATGKSSVLATGYIQLPDDFMRIDTATPVENFLTQDPFQYVSNQDFENFRRQSFASSFNHIYTVQNDPIGLNSKWYLAVYPAITELMVIRGNYYMVPPLMQNDTDVPILPINDRPVAMAKAMHLFARARSDPKQDAYFAEYRTHLENMLLQYDLSDDPSHVTASRRLETHAVDVVTPAGTPDFVPAP